MAGGLMQLVAYGAQDIYLTGDPQITFFKVVYRRYTNFSMECVENTFTGTPAWGTRHTVTVSRNADLIHRCYIQATLPEVSHANVATSGFAWAHEMGHFLLKNVEVQIGGQLIDKHYSEWLSIWCALTLPYEHMNGYADMIRTEEGRTYTSIGTLSSRMHIPLQFWFCRNPGLALPLIALQFHEVKFLVEFETYAVLSLGLYASSVSPTLGDTSMWIDYIYLDTDERRRFAKTSHEYLIEQLQFHGDESISAATNVSLRLNFNHPVKSLHWVVRRDTNVNTTTRNLSSAIGNIGTTGSASTYCLFNWSDDADPASGANPVSTAKLTFNGHDRFAQRYGEYFDLVQHYQHWPRIPHMSDALPYPRGLNTYTFALKPVDHQPTGTANFSRLDNVTLRLTLGTAQTGVVKVFAVNYNVLRITSGMGGLAYAN